MFILCFKDFFIFLLFSITAYLKFKLQVQIDNSIEFINEKIAPNHVVGKRVKNPSNQVPPVQIKSKVLANGKAEYLRILQKH